MPAADSLPAAAPALAPARGAAAPPPLVIVEGPGGGPPMVAAISPQSILNAFESAEKAVPPPACAPPGRAAPPPLRRQNASRFSWPPDPQQAWCYISLPPSELARQCSVVLDRPTTALEVAELFGSAERLAESRAYAAYASRYRRELDELLRS